MEVWICDDNKASSQTLAKLILAQEAAQVRLFGAPESLERALVMEPLPQALFLDIVFQNWQTETLSLGAAERIHRAHPNLPIVFITAYVEYAPEIFEAAPVYLLQKPFDASRVAAALRAVHERKRWEAADVLVIRSRGELHRIPFASIEYVESDRRKLAVHAGPQVLMQYGKLSALLEELPDCFAQCHQSFIVNLNQVRVVCPESVTLLSGRTIPVSRRRRRSFQTAADLFLAQSTFIGDLPL